jgi:hypothetical protein
VACGQGRPQAGRLARTQAWRGCGPIAPQRRRGRISSRGWTAGSCAPCGRIMSCGGIRCTARSSRRGRPRQQQMADPGTLGTAHGQRALLVRVLRRNLSARPRDAGWLAAWSLVQALPSLASGWAVARAIEDFLAGEAGTGRAPRFVRTACSCSTVPTHRWVITRRCSPRLPCTGISSAIGRQQTARRQRPRSWRRRQRSSSRTISPDDPCLPGRLAGAGTRAGALPVMRR